MGPLELLYGVIAFLFAVYYYLIHYYYPSKFEFWKKRGIPGPKPIPFFGTLKDIILRKKILMKYYKEVYDAYKDAPLVGIYDQTVPMLMINDPILIKDVLITDAAVFSGRGILRSTRAEPLLDNLVHRKGEESLRLRAKVSPLFTPSKLKNMCTSLLQRSKIFSDWWDAKLLLMRSDEIDCTELVERIIADFAATCMLNYDIKTIGDDENNIIQYVNKFNKANPWKDTIKQLKPDSILYDLFGYYLFGNAEVTLFLTRFVEDVVNYRKKHGICKRDFVELFTEIKEKKKLNEGIEMTDQTFIAETVFFFFASFDTSAVTTIHALYELASNQIIQDKARKEISEAYAKSKGKITFEDINAMSYLEAIVKETLRKHPVGDCIRRQSSSTYTFRSSQVTIPKDIVVIIPIYGIHLDPDIYPNPDVFDPERFIGEMARSRDSMYFQSFGYGPRSCIGERYGMLQVKIALLTILRNYKIDTCKKTRLENNGELRIIPRPKTLYLQMTKII